MRHIKLKTIQTIRSYSQSFLAYITATVSTYSSVYPVEIMTYSSFLLKTERRLYKSLIAPSLWESLSEAAHTTIDLIRVTKEQGASEQVNNPKVC